MRPTGYLLNTAQLYYNEHWALPRNTTLLSLYSPLHQIYFSNKIHHHQPSSYINTIYNLCIKIFSLFSDCYVSAQDYARVHNKLLDPSLFLIVERKISQSFMIHLLIFINRKYFYSSVEKLVVRSSHFCCLLKPK